MNIKTQNLIYVILVANLFAQTARINPAHVVGETINPFMENATYRDDIRSPDEFYGFTLGTRPLHYQEVIAYFKYLSDLLPNAQMNSYGTTYEDRELIYLVISNKDNMKQLSEIRHKNALLADPRSLKRKDNPSQIIANNPAFAWMTYSIHGDELSSTDAAIQVAYQLLAGTDATSRKIMKETVIIIDPLQNPDGRERYLGQLQQWNGFINNPDAQSLNHTGFWPWGRGNHYLFDLNRDWIITAHPETRGKIKAILEWQPQLMVDAHEMGAYDTYLFTPPRAPFNPFFPKTTLNWLNRFASDHAAAFDKYGWSYYTREWNEELYPGYGSSWGIYTGLVGILYEQAETNGSQVTLPDESLATFREAIHRQFTSSIANLYTLANNRQELLLDYYNHRKQSVDKTAASKAFIFPIPENRSRSDKFIAALTRQNIEVFQTSKKIVLATATNSHNKSLKKVSIPPGSIVIPLNQPLQALIQNMLAFDIRIDNESLEKERRELLKHDHSTIYDVTAWSLPLAYGIEGYYTEVLPKINLNAYNRIVKKGILVNEHPKFGFVIDGTDDGVYIALARLLEKDYKVWCAEKKFAVEEQAYPPGSLLIKVNSNPHLDAKFLQNVAEESGVDILGVNTAFATDGPDLGGNDFSLLKDPHIAILGGSPASTYSFGSLWHLLDTRLNTRVTLLNLTRFSGYDLRKYNVLVLPSFRGEIQAFKQIIGDASIEKLKGWVKNGGTLISVGNSAAFLADSSVAISTVQLRRQVLDKLKSYTEDLDNLKEAEHPVVDSLVLWEGKPQQEQEKAPAEPFALEEMKAADELGRSLRPQGAILKVNIDPEHWLAFGAGESVPVLYNTSYVLMAKKPVQVPGRLSKQEGLRLSGLLWMEAKDRIAETAWATRESTGNGQIILFATQPNFRGYFHASERILLNALYLGPGMGTRQTVKW